MGYVSLHFAVVTKYLLWGLEVYKFSETDTEVRVRGVQYVRYLWRVWILENVKGCDTKIVVVNFEIYKMLNVLF